MYDSPARILPLKIEQGRRILVVSDIHGNLPYLKAVSYTHLTLPTICSV